MCTQEKVTHKQLKQVQQYLQHKSAYLNIAINKHIPRRRSRAFQCTPTSPSGTATRTGARRSGSKLRAARLQQSRAASKKSRNFHGWFSEGSSSVKRRVQQVGEPCVRIHSRGSLALNCRSVSCLTTTIGQRGNRGSACALVRTRRCIDMCIYIYIYIYIYICIHIYIYIYIYIHICMCIHMYIYIYIYIHVLSGSGCFVLYPAEWHREESFWFARGQYPNDAYIKLHTYYITYSVLLNDILCYYDVKLCYYLFMLYNRFEVRCLTLYYTVYTLSTLQCTILK